MKDDFLTTSQMEERVGGWDREVDVLSMAWALLGLMVAVDGIDRGK